MPSPKGDPTYIKDRDKYFLTVAKTVGLASTHPKAPGGCIIVRGREIIGDGRSLFTDSKVEIDCVSYAIAAAAKAGTSTIGSVIYTTRYPFAASVFQAHLMGVNKFYLLAHDWEPYYSDEFRRAGRLARELKIGIIPLHLDEDPRFTTNTHDRNLDQVLFPDTNPFAPDEYDSNDGEITDYDYTTAV